MTSHDTDRDTPPGRETPPGNVHRLQPRRAPPGAMFFAERDPAVQWRSTAVLLMLMAPLAFFAPASFITGTLAALAVGWWNERGFRFAVDRRELIVKIATLAPTLKVPLNEIAEARLDRKSVV